MPHKGLFSDEGITKYGENPQPKNADIPDMEDIPKEKVERKDGLPTEDPESPKKLDPEFVKGLDMPKAIKVSVLKSTSSSPMESPCCGSDKKEDLVMFLKGILGILD